LPQMRNALRTLAHNDMRALFILNYLHRKLHGPIDAWNYRKPSLKENSVRKFLLSLAVLAAVAAVSRPVFADQMEIDAYSLSTFGGEFIKPFDTSLGTLDSVNVSITGVITGQVFTAPNFVPVDGVGGEPVPAPYTADVSLTIEGPYQPVIAPIFEVSGTGTGAGEPESYLINFIYGFTFDATTDLIGGMAALSDSVSGAIDLVDPGLMAGTLAHFESPFPQIPLLTINVPTATPGAGAVGTSVPDIEGALFIQYNYTPNVATAPEPDTLLLLGAGLVGLLGFSRLRFCRSAERV